MSRKEDGKKKMKGLQALPKSPLHKKTMKRLMRDLAELMECTDILPFANAQPSEENMFVWYVTLRKDGGDELHHCIIEFPSDYPKSPPGVLLMTDLSHHNVFGHDFNGFQYSHIPRSIQGQAKHICLDVLKKYTMSSMYTGWSVAYSVRTILLQLTSFLFDASKVSSYGRYGSSNDNQRLLRSLPFPKLYAVPKDFKFKFQQKESTSTFEAQGRRPRSGDVVLALWNPDSYESHQISMDTYRWASCEQMVRSCGYRWEQAQVDCRSGEGVKLFFNCDKSRTYWRKLSVVRPMPRPKKRSTAVVAKPKSMGVLKLSRSAQQFFDIAFLVKELLDFCDLQTMINMLDISAIESSVGRFNMVEAKQTVCFFTKKGVHDLVRERNPLGVGLNVTRYPSDRPDPLTKDSNRNVAKEITSPMDMLCKEAFHTEKVRTGVWGESIERWIPLVLNQKHGNVAYNLILHTIQDLAPKDNLSHLLTSKARQAESILHVVGTLMNANAVSILKSSGGMESSNIDTSKIKPSLCEKALVGYCSFHHMLLYLASRIPEVRDLANKRVEEFLANPGYRHKMFTRDLGIFMCYMCISDKTWEEVAPALLQEGLSRSVYWIRRKQRDDGISPRHQINKDTFGEYGDEWEGQDTFWKYSVVARRIFMFQAWFMRNVARPNGASWQEMYKRYNDSLGQPSQDLKRRLFESVTKICKVQTWYTYYRCVGARLRVEKSSAITKELYRACSVSEAAAYYVSREDNRRGFRTNDINLIAAYCEFTKRYGPLDDGSKLRAYETFKRNVAIPGAFDSHRSIFEMYKWRAIFCKLEGIHADWASQRNSARVCKGGNGFFYKQCSKAFSIVEGKHGIRRQRLAKKKVVARPVLKAAPKPSVNPWKTGVVVKAPTVIPSVKIQKAQTSPQAGPIVQPVQVNGLKPVCAPPVHTPPAPPTPPKAKRQRKNVEASSQLPRTKSEVLVTAMKSCAVATKHSAPKASRPLPTEAQTHDQSSVHYYVIVNHGGARYFDSAPTTGQERCSTLAHYLSVVPTRGDAYKANNCTYVKSLTNQKWLEIQNNGNEIAVETSIRGNRVFQVVTPRGCTFRSRCDIKSRVSDVTAAARGNVYFALRATDSWVQIREGLWLPIKVPTPNGQVEILREVISFNLNPSSAGSSPVAAPICAASSSATISETPRKGNLTTIQRPTPFHR